MSKYNLVLTEYAITKLNIDADPALANQIGNGSRVKHSYAVELGVFEDEDVANMHVILNTQVEPALNLSVEVTGLFTDKDGTDLKDLPKSIEDIREMFETLFPYLRTAAMIATSIPGTIINPPLMLDEPDLDSIFTDENLERANGMNDANDDADDIVRDDIADEIAAAFGGAISFDKGRLS